MQGGCRRALVVSLGLAMTIAMPSGCGSDDNGGTGAGGSAGAGGGAAGGAGGPAVAEGSFQLFVGPVPNAELKEGELPCPFPPRTFKIGEVDATSHTSIADGTDSTAVGCAVKSQGGGLTLSGTVTRKMDSLGLQVATLVEGKGEAKVAINIDPNLLGGDTPCTIETSRTIEGSQLGAAPGTIWARLSCPRLEAIGIAPARICRAEGYLRLANCER